MTRSHLERRLAGIPPFDEVPEDVLVHIAGHLSIRELVPDELLYGGEGETGDAGDSAPGRLAVLAGKGTDTFEVARVGPGEVIGEIAALLGGERIATARAVADSEVLTFTARGGSPPSSIGRRAWSSTCSIRRPGVFARLTWRRRSIATSGRRPTMAAIHSSTPSSG